MTPAMREIVREVAARHRVRAEDILSESRQRPHARARQEVMFLMVETGRWSLPRIGAHLGRHHTSVLFGARAHAARLREVPDDLARWRGLGKAP